MANVRRLQAADQAAHAAHAAATKSGEPVPVDLDDALGVLASMNSTEAGRGDALIRDRAAVVVPTREPLPVESEDGEDDGHGGVSSPIQSEPPEVDGAESAMPEPAVMAPESGRTGTAAPADVIADAVAGDSREREVLDILAAMAPVFRAASIFPGMAGTPTQIEDAIRQMSRSAAQLADALARDTDTLEVDLRWRRRRSTAFTAELVAAHWVSTAIKQGGAAFDGHGLTESTLPHLARGIQAAIEVARTLPSPAVACGSRAAAALALAPLVLDLQRYEDLLQTMLPDVIVEIDAAAHAIGAVAGEEVRLGVARLGKLLPGAARDGLASELLAHVGPMALAAWEQARGEILAQLQQAPDAAAAMAVLASPGMTGSIPLTHIVDRLRPMVRRLVGTAEYAAREMLGVQVKA